jgi:hypothetical protein
LEEQQQERASTIKKLKETTKYDTTQELLNKYGGADARPQSRDDRRDQADSDDEDTPNRKRHQGARDRPAARIAGRTNLPPPPTANIPRHPLSPAAGPPQQHGPGMTDPQLQNVNAPASVPVTEEFAPNAFGQTPPPPPQAYARYEAATESHWYDRVLDLLLGEDETAAKNRIVLVCRQCKLVNGQAPPGTQALSDLGMWKCMSCGALNGEVDEGQRIVREVLEESSRTRPASGEEDTDGSGVKGEFEEDSGVYQDERERSSGSQSGDGLNGTGSGARRRKGQA